MTENNYEEERFEYRNITDSYYKRYLARKQKCRAVHQRLSNQNKTVIDWGRIFDDELNNWSDMLLFGVSPENVGGYSNIIYNGGLN